MYLHAKKKGRWRRRSTVVIKTSLIEVSSTPRRMKTDLRKRSLCRPRGPQNRRMRNYANLPALRTPWCGSDTTTTWRITMRTWWAWRKCVSRPFHHNAFKHINVRYHFVRDCVISGKIGLQKISTVDNVADGMTKCLSEDRFRSLRHQMGLIKNHSD